MKLTEAEIATIRCDIKSGMRISDYGETLLSKLLVERDEQAAEIKRLRDFIKERVATCRYVKKAGYHGRRVSMEAAKLLAEPEYFPGRRKVAEGTDADPEEETQ